MAGGRSPAGQAGAQLATLATTIAISALGGILTGLVMRIVGRFQSRGRDIICPESERFNDNSTFLRMETDQHQSETIEVEKIVSVSSSLV